MYISFSQASTYEQIEAAGGLYKAVFKLAEAYGIKDPAKLINDCRSMTEYHITNALEEQAKVDEVVDDTTEDTTKRDMPEKVSDLPINLDDIPF